MNYTLSFGMIVLRLLILSNKEGVWRESGEDFKWKIPDVNMRALTDYWIRYVHECEIWFSLAVSCWPYFILHPRNMWNPAQENDSVLIRMSSVFVRTTASRSLCLWMPATLFVTHVGTQFYSDRQMWQYKCANQSNELVEYTYEMHAT